MSTRRKSTRATNFNNIQEQQRNEKIQKRQAVRGGDGVRQQVHRVLTEAALQTVWQLYEKYANASPLLERYAEDGGGTGSSAAGARRSERRRAGNSGGGAAADDDGAGGGAVKEALAGAEAAAAAEAARVWEENGHHCLDLLEPLLLPPDTAAPKHVQEALMHLVLNAEAHRTHLSARALSLLERLLERHPPVRLVGVGGTPEPGVGDQGGDEEDEEEQQEGSGGAGGAGSARRPHLEVNPDLWEPVSGTWTRAPLCGLPRLARGLQQLRGLMLLAGGAHNCVARAVEAAGHPALPRASDKDAAECGDVGQLLLLRYWVRMLCADMEVRLQAAHSSLGARGRAEEAAEAGGEAEEAEARAAVDGSLLLRLLKTADLNLGWQYETNAKPKLVRLLASTAVYGAMGARAGAVLPLPGGHGSSGAGARPGGPGGVVAVPPVVASRLLVAGGPGEVGRLAGRLLGCLAGGLAAMEAADGYSRRRSAAVAYNERVEMDRRLAKVVGKEAVYGNPDNVQALLSCLPAASCVRLLSYLVVEAAEEQLSGAAVAGAGGGGGGVAALAALAAHYMDGGVKDSPPPVLASPALRYLLGDQDPQGGGGQEGGQEGQEGGGGHWAWGLRCMRLNSQMPGRVGLPLLVAALAAAGWRHAEEEARRAEAHEGAGEAERQDAEDDEPEAGAGARLTAAQWRRELAAVAALSQRAAARLRAEGLVRVADGAGAGAGAGVGGVGADGLAIYIQMRCAEQLAERLGNPGAAAVAAV